MTFRNFYYFSLIWFTSINKLLLLFVLLWLLLITATQNEQKKSQMSFKCTSFYHHILCFRGRKLCRGLTAWRLKSLRTWRPAWKKPFSAPLELDKKWSAAAEVNCMTKTSLFSVLANMWRIYEDVPVLAERSPYGSHESVRWRKNVTLWRQNADRVDKYVSTVPRFKLLAT